MARRRARARSGVVLDRLARRQSGARQSDGCGAEASLLRASARAGLQGGRGRLSGGVEGGLRLRPRPDRRGLDSDGCHDRGRDPGATGADRADVRGHRRRAAGDRPFVQLDVRRTAARRLRARAGGDNGARCRGRCDVSPPCCGGGDGGRLLVLAGELSPHRARLRRRDLRGRCVRVGADARAEDDRQPANDGRAFSAQRVCGPDRVVRASVLAAGLDHGLGASPQRSGHGGRDSGARSDGRRRTGRGNAVRQRRENGKRRPRDTRAYLLTQGVDPALDLSHLDEARRIVEECNETPVHPRHPWVGDLVYTAFSGSHQDAIRKGMHAQAKAEAGTPWEVPYLPIDPDDIGRTYEAIIRVNSQSGKGGVAYLLASRYALELPRGLQIDFAQRVQAVVDAKGGELTAEEIYELFRAGYLDVRAPYGLAAYSHTASEAGDRLTAQILVDDRTVEIAGTGNGPIDALVDALGEQLGIVLRVLDYHEHATGIGADASAAAYVGAEVDGDLVWGVGI